MTNFMSTIPRVTTIYGFRPGISAIGSFSVARAVPGFSADRSSRNRGMALIKSKNSLISKGSTFLEYVLPRPNDLNITQS
jgi:hypothetical protein